MIFVNNVVAIDVIIFCHCCCLCPSWCSRRHHCLCCQRKILNLFDLAIPMRYHTWYYNDLWFLLLLLLLSSLTLLSSDFKYLRSCDSNEVSHLILQRFINAVIVVIVVLVIVIIIVVICRYYLDLLPCKIWRFPNFRQEIRQSHYRNDPVKYDLVWANNL